MENDEKCIKHKEYYGKASNPALGARPANQKAIVFNSIVTDQPWQHPYPQKTFTKYRKDDATKHKLDELIPIMHSRPILIPTIHSFENGSEGRMTHPLPRRALVDSPGTAWTNLGSLGLAWTHLDSPGPTWTYLGSLGLTWIRLDSIGLIWPHLASLGLAWDASRRNSSPFPRPSQIRQTNQGLRKASCARFVIQLPNQSLPKFA